MSRESTFSVFIVVSEASKLSIYTTITVYFSLSLSQKTRERLEGGNGFTMQIVSCYYLITEVTNIYDLLLHDDVIKWKRFPVASLAICEGNSPVTGEFYTQWAVTRSFDVFFDLCLNKQLSKQSGG